MVFDELKTDVVSASHRLLGAILEREINGRTVRVRIVEVEAYHEQDAASHSYKHRTGRSRIMFEKAGVLYVYFTYGMHYCCNVVTGEEGEGSAVLIRAVEPLEGEDILIENRNGIQGVDVTNGPAKLCQALSINRNFNGHDLTEKPLKLLLQTALPGESIGASPRIGISQAKDELLRFYIKNNPYLSRK